MAKKTYIVASPVHCDNKLFGVGQSISLEDSDAAAPLKVGAIKPTPEESKEVRSTKSEKTNAP